MKNPVGKPLAFKTVEELEDKVEAFFTSDDAHIINFKEGQEEKIYAPTMSGLALFLDVDRKTITNYSNKEEYFPTIRKARARIESHLEKKLYGNNVTGLIFNLKNNFDWKDKSEVAQTNVEMSHEQWLDTLD
ncbi:MAG: DNA-packaging protein [Colwellia sp.]|nr:DNA-packaging protein [Colwellia sp.]